ncbi:MAG: hypothetical protein GY856_55250 [bacterium]|nr:hypothetical protein [bacterium]
MAGRALGLAWIADGSRLAVATAAGVSEVWDLTGPEPRRLVRLYEAPPVAGLAVTEDGYVDGPEQALAHVRFVDGWAVYDLGDLPDRHSPDRVREALRRPG